MAGADPDGRARDHRLGIATGVAFAAALTCKYTAVFMAVPIALAYVLSPQRPGSLRPYGAWVRWALRGIRAGRRLS